MGWETGNWKQSDDVPCAKEDLHAANRCSSRQYCRADLIAVRRIQSSGAGLVFGEFGRVFARRLVFPAIAWRQLHFQPARSSRRACAYVRQSSSISLPHLPSNSSSRTTRILTATLVLCLYHSLGLYIAYSISSPPSLLLIASGPQSTISQSIAPPHVVTPPPSNVLPRSKAQGTVQSYISGQVSSRYSRRQSGSFATPRRQVVSSIPTTHLNTNATTTLEA
jgi:hypothetical protein